MLLKLLDDVKSWPELEAEIASLPLEQERGDAFEQFCKAFFLLDPVFQFKEVYRQKEIPPSILVQLGYPGRQDIGIDGLAITVDGKLFAYQAKFRSDRDNTPTLRELSTFFTVSDRADWRITITNANNLPTAINDRTKQSRILADRFDQLDADFFNCIRIYLKERCVSSPAIRAPHKTQQEAIDAALAHFKDQSRGQLILPCGAGKTLAAMWIAEKMGGSRILVLVPSLALMSQTLKEWAANTSARPFRYLCLCSDTSVDLGEDSPIEHLYEMDVPVTTDVNLVTAFLADEKPSTSVLFSTYQSSKVLSEAVLRTDTVFDIAIFDEAHRTTGTDVAGWGLALRDEKVPIKNRIFMTATPRIYAPHITKKAKEEDILICSMDDTDIYGRPFYEMTFGAAIERGHITDYKIVVICVTDSEVREIIQRGGRVITDDEHEWDAKAFAKRVALVKGMKAYGLKKVFTFHARVNGAKAFTDTKTPYGIGQVFKLLEPENDNAYPPLPLFEKVGMGGFSEKAKFFHVNGTMSSGVRNSIMKEFREAEIGIMSNARCLTEGVDVPAVDTVAFIDPKKSLIDIVQATGRAMRKAEWKERGYIFIPVVVGEDANPDEIIESSDFATVWEVLQAMIDQDQRLEKIVSQMRVLQGKGEEGTQAWKDSMNEYTNKMEFCNSPSKIDKTRFINTLHTKTVEVIGKSWDFWYGLLIQYKSLYGDTDVPNDYLTSEEFNLGNWVASMKTAYRKGKLDQVKLKRLEEIGFSFVSDLEPFERTFKRVCMELIKYKNNFGNINVPQFYKSPEGYKLGSKLSILKGWYEKRKLDTEKLLRLEGIGLILEDTWEKGFCETLRYREQFGDVNVPLKYKTPKGYKLWKWQNAQRLAYKKVELIQDKVKRLEETGFNWDLHWDIDEEAFQKGIKLSLKYKEQFGDVNTPIKYKTSDGYRLGQWQNAQRAAYKKGNLANDRIKILEEIGFSWPLNNYMFKEGIHATLLYLKQSGDANAPEGYITPEGFDLGLWQAELIKSYKEGKLDNSKIKILKKAGVRLPSKSIPIKYVNATTEEGILASLKYKEQFGDVNVSESHLRCGYYHLGQWQNAQRLAYKQGRLASDKIKKLEEIGFRWDFKGR